MNSLEMRICGDEAHIKIGLSDLFITAAPVLRMLAEKNIVYTLQCIIYLIECINDKQQATQKAISTLQQQK